jgi:hypothetical protein
MPSKMKSCERYRAVLSDAAAAEVEPSSELRSHLDACASCRAAFSEELQLFAAIDIGLRAAANSEVPASLLPRVHAELNERSVPSRSWMPASAAIAAAAVVVAAIVFVRGFVPDTISTNPSVNTSTHNMPSAEIRPAPTVVSPLGTTTLPAKRRSFQPTKTEPSVKVEQAAALIPAGQKQAMDALLAGLREGAVKTDVLLTTNPEQPLRDLQVLPLEVSPIEMKPLEDVSAESASQNEKTRR